MRQAIGAALVAAFLSLACAILTAPSEAGNGSSLGVASATSSGAAIPWRVDALGNQGQNQVTRYATYTVQVGLGAGNAIVAAANPTDIFMLTGSDSRVVTVESVTVMLAQTSTYTATFANGPAVSFVKRSGQDTNGTRVALTGTAFSHDDPASATATAFYYTANPSALGTQSFASCACFVNIPVLTGAPTGYTTGTGTAGVTNSQNFSKGIVLHGTSECFSINLGGTAHAGLAFALAVAWTETLQ